MQDLIKINNESERPTVMGRELHEKLEVKTAYKDWFPRMCEYGFTEGTDFNSLKIEQVQIEGGRDVKREITDHQLTIAMAKEICMLQRSEKGKEFRQYFIAVEEQWNTPECVMARALDFAKKQLEKVKHNNIQLTNTVAVQNQQIAELQPKASYYDLVLNCKDLIAISVIAKDYGMSAKKLNKYLQAKKIQYRQGKNWLLYQNYAELGYTSTKTHTHPSSDGGIHTEIYTQWTQKGRLFLYELLKKDGIIPLIEREYSDMEQTEIAV